MPSSIPQQKFYFYHLPTRGRAGIKLGDAWYVFSVSIIFDCSMLLYLLFWTILGFIFHFYITFGTNLLTGGPTQNCCFLPFSVFRRNIISNGVQTEWNLWDRDFPTERDPGAWTLLQVVPEEVTRVEGAPPYLVGPSELHRHTPSSYIYLCIPKRSEQEPKPNSTAATFCIHEIPSWCLFRSSAWRGPSSRRASTSST